MRLTISVVQVNNICDEVNNTSAAVNCNSDAVNNICYEVNNTSVAVNYTSDAVNNICGAG